MSNPFRKETYHFVRNHTNNHVGLISLATFLVLLGGLFITVNNAQQIQTLQQHASMIECTPLPIQCRDNMTLCPAKPPHGHWCSGPSLSPTLSASHCQSTYVCPTGRPGFVSPCKKVLVCNPTPTPSGCKIKPPGCNLEDCHTPPGGWCPSVTNQPAKINHWIIEEYVPYELKSNPVGAKFVESLNNPSTYEILTYNNGVTDLLPNATHVKAFDSYQAIQTAFTNNQIPANVKVILYDNERWAGTPLDEQQHPFTYVPLAEKLVHQHGLLFMDAPAPDLNTSIEGNKTYDNYSGYLHLQLGTLAKYTDIFEIQGQHAGGYPTKTYPSSVPKYISFAQQAYTQAHTANPDIPILLGITTNGSSPDEMIGEMKGTVSLSDGYWLNVIGGTQGINIVLPLISTLPSM